MKLQHADDHVVIEGTNPAEHAPDGVDTHLVRTTNRHAQVDPLGYDYVTRAVADATREAVDAGIERGPATYAGPAGRSRLVEVNRPAARFFTERESPAAPADRFDVDYMPRWREHVPSAKALWPLQHPCATQLPFDGDAATGAMDRLIWRHVADAVGIRSRAAVMAAVVRANLGEAPEDMRWLSLASGAAVPVLGVARDLVEQEHRRVSIDLLDFDADALALARASAVDAGLEASLGTEVFDLFDLELLDRLAGVGEPYDMVDVLGFFEYLPDDPIDVGGGRPVPSASEFLRQALRFTRPGGIAVIANMLDTHPQLDFVLRVVQWPFIRPRSLEQLVGLVEQAGVRRDQLTLLLPDDGVYAVAVVRP